MEPDREPEASKGSSASRETLVGMIVAGYVDRLNQGAAIDPEEIRREHPDVAGEVLEQLEVFVGASESSRRLEGSLGTLGEFTLRREIGRGGMGVVYEAWQGSMERRVALKVLPAAVASDEKALNRFLREARAAGKLHHTNIVGVYGLGIAAGTPYYAMEYVEGRTLEQVLRTLRDPASSLSGNAFSYTTSPLGSRAIAEALAAEPASAEGPTDGGPAVSSGARGRDIIHYGEVARAFAEVAEALQHAHSHGVVHRDIKPSNLILEGGGEGSVFRGRLRILDFGLARLEGQQSLTVSGDFLGTVLYASPEQAMARRVPIDHRTDIYSLGVTMYEVLTLEPPFRGKNPQDTLSQILLRDPPSPRRRCPEVPKDLETIVLKCLRKDPRDRYGTAEALAQDLRRFLQGNPIEARPQTVWEKLARRAWRSRGRIAAAVLGLLLLMTAGLLAANHFQEIAARRRAEYERTVIGAIVKMEFGRSARLSEERQRASRSPASPRQGGAASRRASGVAYAEGLRFGPDPLEDAAADLGKAAKMLPGRRDAWYHLARTQQFLGRPADALASLRRALLCDARFVPALVLEASLLKRSGDASEAEEAKRRAGAVDDEWARAWIAAKEAEEGRQWAAAVKAYERIIDIESRTGQGYLGSALSARLGSGQARLELEDYDGALVDFAVAHALEPDRAGPVLFLGKTYILKKNPAKAAETFEKLVATSPRQDEAILAVTEIYTTIPDYEGALTWAERAAPSAERELKRAKMLFRIGRQEAALRVLREGVRLYPGDAMLAVLYGSFLKTIGRFEEAIGYVRRALDLAPRLPEAQSTLGDVLYRQGRFEEAMEAYRKALELDPKYYGARHNIGILLARQGKLDEAIAEYRKAIEIDPKLPTGHNSLSVALREEGRHEEALAELQKSIEVDPWYALSHDNYGLALLEQGKRPEAEREFEKAIEVDPNDFRPLGHLAQSRWDRGEREEAVLLLEKADRLPRSSLRARLNSRRLELFPVLASFASVDAAFRLGERTAIIPEGSEWRFFRGVREPSPGMEWTEQAFDDSSWETGPSGFGYGPGKHGTVLDDMEGRATTLYLRRTFEVDDPGSLSRLSLVMKTEGGLLAFLNGVEAFRAGAGEEGSRIPFDGLATDGADLPGAVLLDAALVRAGRNVLAIQSVKTVKDEPAFTVKPELWADISLLRAEGLRWARVARALEVIGSGEARSVLEKLAAEGSWPWRTPGPRESLDRLRSRAPSPAARPPVDSQEVRQVPETATWSTDRMDVTPLAGRRFRGPFANDRVALKLDGLPAHRSLRLRFNLLLIGSLEGNQSTDEAGPDIIEVGVENGPTLLRTTFATRQEWGSREGQSYPDPFPIGEHPPLLGAREKAKLGYLHNFQGRLVPADGVYALSFTFPHSAPSVTILFSGFGLQGIPDEGWALEDVAVEPLPDALPLDPGEAEQLWAALGGRDALAANEALWRLVASGDEAGRFLAERIEATREVRERSRRELIEHEAGRFAPAIAAARAKGKVDICTYLEGRLLQRAGSLAEAAGKFAEAAAADPKRPEPFTRLAECLRSLGRPAEAEARAREALRGPVEDSGALLDLWFDLCAADLKLSAREMLERMPRREAGDGKDDDREEDLRWVLEGLVRDGALRINCGGDEHRSPGGTVWSRDRFFRSGSAHVTDGAPAAASADGAPRAEDGVLLETERRFHWKGIESHGYRIPLPAGKYRFTLLFAETRFQEAGKRAFDVLLEGRKVLDRYGPPVGQADAQTFEADVADGRLDIEFLHRMDDPQVSAISIISIEAPVERR